MSNFERIYYYFGYGVRIDLIGCIKTTHKLGAVP